MRSTQSQNISECYSGKGRPLGKNRHPPPPQCCVKTMPLFGAIATSIKKCLIAGSEICQLVEERVFKEDCLTMWLQTLHKTPRLN